MDIENKIEAVRQYLNKIGLDKTLGSLTIDDLRVIVELVDTSGIDEEMSFYRLAAARNERLQEEIGELRKRFLESQGMPKHVLIDSPNIPKA